MPHRIPEQFGRYQINRSLGSGGMGEVFLAHDTMMDSLVALKIPFLDKGQTARATERFYREARVMFGLRHPNLCPVYDVGEFDGYHYLVMAYIEGVPLSKWLGQQGQITVQDAVKLVSTIASAVDVAHRNHIVHRDLKPENIMIEDGGVPVVMDFGLALETDAAQSRLTQTGVVLGTPAYMSIEQVMGQTEQIGLRTDVYSLGVILYELLCGRLPFEGGTTVVLGKIIGSEAPPLSEWNSSIDPQLESICMQAMAKQPDDRFASMSEFAAALDEYLAQTSATPSGKVGGTSLFATIQTQPNLILQPTSRSQPKKSLWDEEPQTTPETKAATVETTTSLDQTTIQPQPVVTKDGVVRKFFAKWRKPIVATMSVVALTTAIFLVAISKPDPASSNLTTKSSQPTTSLTEAEKSDPPTVLVSDTISQAFDGIKTLATRNQTSEPSNVPTENSSPPPELIETSNDTPKPTPQVVVKQDSTTKPPQSADSVVASVSTNKAPSANPLPIPNAKPRPALMRSPFNASQAEAGQKVWAAYLEMPTMKLNSATMVMVLIPPGSFKMGSPRSESDREDDEHQVQVTLTRPFYLGQYEVTQRQWFAVVGTKPWSGKPTVHEGDYQAASYISWNDARSFCKKLTDKEHRSGQLPKEWAYALPTEAQWEYACRAGTTTTYCFGDDEAGLKFVANYRDLRNHGSGSSKNSYQVGSKTKNAWGLADMHGNLREWCEDRYSRRLPGGPDPLVTQGNYSRISRGGSWTEPARFARSASRGPLEFDRIRYGRKQYLNAIPNFDAGKNGFRVALVQTTP